MNAAAPRTPRVLLIDDEVDFAKMLGTMLRTRGYNTTIVHSGWEAREEIKNNPPEVALVDLKLPDTDGIQLLGLIKEVSPDTEVVILTGYADLESALKALHLGAFGYLRKPCSPDRLFLSIENALRHRRQKSSESELLGKVLQATNLPVAAFHPRTGTIIASTPAFVQLIQKNEPAAYEKMNLKMLFNGNDTKFAEYQETLNKLHRAEVEIELDNGSPPKHHYKLLSLLSPDPDTALALLFDISSYHQELHRNRKTIDYLKAIWENIATGVMIVDSRFTIQDVNPCFARWYNLRVEDLVGRKCHEILHHLSHPCHLYGESCPIIKSMASGTVSRVQYYHIVSAGSATQKVAGTGNGTTGTADASGDNPRYMETVVAPLYDENGTQIAFVVLITDLTEIKRAHDDLEKKSAQLKELNEALLQQQEQLEKQAEELKKSNLELLRLSAAKDEFVATVSHELRTPLTVIAESISLIADCDDDTAKGKRQKLIQAAQRNCRRLTELIEDLLDLAKLEAGRMHTTPVEFNILKLSQEVIESLHPVFKEKGLMMKTEFPSQPLMVNADERHIRRILLNLLSNAIKFTPAGEIIVRVEQQGNEVVVAVIDTGIGIPEEEQKNIFNRFYQVQQKTGVRAPGTGLGLAITRELVTLNNGRIWFTSTPGKGSAFYFTIPLKPITKSSGD